MPLSTGHVSTPIKQTTNTGYFSRVLFLLVHRLSSSRVLPSSVAGDDSWVAEISDVTYASSSYNASGMGENVNVYFNLEYGTEIAAISSVNGRSQFELKGIFSDVKAKYFSLNPLLN